MNAKSRLLGALIVLAIFLSVFFFQPKANDLPLVAIANYGPHPSLEASILGIKKALAKAGFVEGKTIRYDIENVNFDPSLIPQMIQSLAQKNPKVMVVLTTPVAQFAKGSVRLIPLIFDAVTDPVQAGLLKDAHQPDKNMTGSSDQQDLGAMLRAVKNLIPYAKSVGVLYATSESNDLALVKLMRQAARPLRLNVVTAPVNETRDIPLAMNIFKGKVDFIYVGASGPIQPALPMIAKQARDQHLAVINVEESAVQSGLALASIGVNYEQVGFHAGELVAKILKGTPINTLSPIYPNAQDQQALISQSQAQMLGLKLPPTLKFSKILR